MTIAATHCQRGGATGPGPGAAAGVESATSQKSSVRNASRVAGCCVGTPTQARHADADDHRTHDERYLDRLAVQSRRARSRRATSTEIHSERQRAEVAQLGDLMAPPVLRVVGDGMGAPGAIEIVRRDHVEGADADAADGMLGGHRRRGLRVAESRPRARRRSGGCPRLRAAEADRTRGAAGCRTTSAAQSPVPRRARWRRGPRRP